MIDSVDQTIAYATPRHSLHRHRRCTRERGEPPRLLLRAAARLRALADALAHALTSLPIFAGRATLAPWRRLGIRCRGQGVPLTSVSSDRTLREAMRSVTAGQRRLARRPGERRRGSMGIRPVVHGSCHPSCGRRDRDRRVVSPRHRRHADVDVSHDRLVGRRCRRAASRAGDRRRPRCLSRRASPRRRCRRARGCDPSGSQRLPAACCTWPGRGASSARCASTSPTTK